MKSIRVVPRKSAFVSVTRRELFLWKKSDNLIYGRKGKYEKYGEIRKAVLSGKGK